MRPATRPVAARWITAGSSAAVLAGGLFLSAPAAQAAPGDPACTCQHRMAGQPRHDGGELESLDGGQNAAVPYAHKTRIGKEPDMKPVWSLRRLGLIVVGIGAGIAVAMILLQEIANRIWHPGALIGPGLLFIGGCAVALVGLGILVVDAMLRLTGRRL